MHTDEYYHTRCYTCGKVLASYGNEYDRLQEEYYVEELENAGRKDEDLTSKEKDMFRDLAKTRALDELNINRICCRTKMLRPIVHTYVDVDYSKIEGHKDSRLNKKPVGILASVERNSISRTQPSLRLGETPPPGSVHVGSGYYVEVIRPSVPEIWRHQALQRNQEILPTARRTYTGPREVTIPISKPLPQRPIRTGSQVIQQEAKNIGMKPLPRFPVNRPPGSNK